MPIGTYGQSYRNYLRVRGEYQNNSSKGTRWAELPPRARRILFLCHTTS